MATPSYSLRDKVTFSEREGEYYLVSSFPLKAARISPQLKPLFSYLESRPGADLDELAGLLPTENTEKLGVYLTRLAKRGFLEENGKGCAGEEPTVSVIIPVRNRPKDLASCLSSLLKLDYPKEKLEIIVVDDASTDNTPDVASRYPVVLKCMPNRKGASYCRNVGAELAQNDILCFLDSDCTSAPDWLNELGAAFLDSKVGGAGGLVESHDDKTGLDRYEQVKSSLCMGNVARDSSNGDRFFYVPSCNLAVRREVYRGLGGFREELEVGEDVDLCWRMTDRGHVIEYLPSARVYHRHRNEIKSFCRRRFDYGTSEPLLQKLHPNREKRFPLWPKAFVFWLLLAFAALLGQPLLLVPALIWLMADAWQRHKKAARQGWPATFPLVFLATVRIDLSALYHLCSFVSRYYLLPTILITPFLPVFGGVLWGMHFGVALAGFVILKPELNPVAFCFYFTLEQISYQTGVWWACLKFDFFAPVLPRLRMRVD